MRHVLVLLATLGIFEVLKTGLGEIDGSSSDLLEADFWPGTVWRLPVIRPEPVPTTHPNRCNSQVRISRQWTTRHREVGGGDAGPKGLCLAPRF
jgi:hypothetical protein